MVLQSRQLVDGSSQQTSFLFILKINQKPIHEFLITNMFAFYCCLHILCELNWVKKSHPNVLKKKHMICNSISENLNVHVCFSSWGLLIQINRLKNWNIWGSLPNWRPSRFRFRFWYGCSFYDFMTKRQQYMLICVSVLKSL